MNYLVTINIGKMASSRYLSSTSSQTSELNSSNQTFREVATQVAAYHNWVQSNGESTIPFTANSYKTSDETTLKFYGKLSSDLMSKWAATLPLSLQSRRKIESMYNIIKPEWNCHICAKRMNTIGIMYDVNGPIFRKTGTENSHQQQIQVCIHGMARIARGRECNPNQKFTLILPESINEDYFNKLSDLSKPQYVHYYLPPSSKNPKTFGTLSEQETKIYYAEVSNSLKTYVPLIIAMLNKFTRDDLIAIERSCEYLETVLKTATYAHNLIPGFNWFKRAIEMIKSHSAISYDVWYDDINEFSHLPLKSQMDIVGNLIIPYRIKLLDDDSDIYGITEYHQFNKNIISLLENAKSLRAMKTMVEERCCPTNYQRKTAQPNERNIQKSIEKLGDYQFIISTCAQLEQKDGCYAIVSPGVNQNSNGGAMAAMLALTRRGSKYDFGSRIREINMQKRVNPTTLTELMTLIQAEEITSLKLQNTDLHETVYIAEHNINDRYVISPDYGWAFLNKESPRFYGEKNITHVFHINKGNINNIVFIIENSKSCRKITTNVGWSNFLAESIRKTCGHVFEKVGQKVPVSYPGISNKCVGESYKTPNLAIGVGVSVIDEYNSLNRSVQLRINNQSFLCNISIC